MLVEFNGVAKLAKLPEPTSPHLPASSTYAKDYDARSTGLSSHGGIQPSALETVSY